MHHPLERLDRWQAYLDGATRQYRAHGILPALGRHEIADGRTTSLFYVAVDETDRVVAGMRCHGPLRVASEAYVLRELDGLPQLETVRELINERVGHGLVEAKGAWIDADLSRPGLSDVLARCIVHAMAWFRAQFAMCTCADKIAPRWETTGGRALADLSPVPYPDGRYQTVLLWWEHDRLEELSDADQWSLVVSERDELQAARPSSSASRTSRRRPETSSGWRTEILDERVAGDAARLEELMVDPALNVLDRWGEQLEGLRKVRSSIVTDPEEEGPRWVHYPWRRTLVRLLGPVAFRELRLDRNRNKITREEQARLTQLRIGVVGLSVGHSIAHALALEGICGELRLADFDTIELSNLNRIPATVLDLGLNKGTVVSRRIAELDPYLRLDVVPEGLTVGNIEPFIHALDVVVDECDSLDLKLLVREAARRSRIPVLMETSDRGLLDVERFDLEPDRPLFHGLLGDVQPTDLVGLSTHDKVPYVLRILEPEQLSSRMAASMIEVDETLTTWPQLGGDVTLGAATIAAAIRRLGRGEDLASGRVRIDLEANLDRVSEPNLRPAGRPPQPLVPSPPADPTLAVTHAANLAPSGGNSQPWILRPEDGRLRILLDRTRTSAMDVRFRGSYVAIGAALLNARIAAAAHGILGSVDRFPDGEDADLVIDVNFGDATDAELAGCYAGMLDRSTNRRPGQPSIIHPSVIEDFHRQVADEGARLYLITAEDGLEDCAELLGESDRLRFLSPLLHREMMSELRWPGEDSLETGIDVRTLELDEADLAKLTVTCRLDVMANLSAWDGGRALGEVTRERVRSSSALAVVTVPDTRPDSYLAGGSGVQRLWLTANAAGLGVQPVSPLSVFAVDDSDFAGLVPTPYVVRLQALASRLRSLARLEDGDAIALVLRLSHVGAPSTRSLRIPIERFTSTPPRRSGTT